MQRNLTTGSVPGQLIRFSLPYLAACFLQTFYGMADLFITGRFYGADTIAAVAVGSQVMHMLTVVIVGLAMGSTVAIGRATGAGDEAKARRMIGNSICLFGAFAAALTLLLLLATGGVLGALNVPAASRDAARAYLLICFAGTPCITAYNVLASVFRGLGDSSRPMIFVAVAGAINVGLDVLLIGPMGLGAAGAALATVASQALSVGIAFHSLRKKGGSVLPRRADLRPDRASIRSIASVGAPVAVQDGIVQIGFLVITRIANARGVDVAAAVGIVEKIISFLFLTPSAMLSSVSALASQNLGAGLAARARQTLYWAMGISVAVGLVFFTVCQFAAEGIVGLFTRDGAEVVRLGGEYLRAYSLDCVLAAGHFCFSGYFCAIERSVLSFAHNLASVTLVRIPGAWLASRYWPQTLYPMGLAAPLGSGLSTILCAILYMRSLREKRPESGAFS